MLSPRLHTASYPVIWTQTQRQVKMTVPRWVVTIYRTVGSTRSFQDRAAVLTGGRNTNPAISRLPAELARGPSTVLVSQQMQVAVLDAWDLRGG